VTRRHRVPSAGTPNIRCRRGLGAESAHRCLSALDRLAAKSHVSAKPDPDSSALQPPEQHQQRGDTPSERASNKRQDIARNTHTAHNAHAQNRRSGVLLHRLKDRHALHVVGHRNAVEADRLAPTSTPAPRSLGSLPERDTAVRLLSVLRGRRLMAGRSTPRSRSAASLNGPLGRIWGV
jgi:hypothetical protein